MKYLLSILTGALVLVPLLQAQGFSDTQVSWYRESIADLAEIGVVNGFTDDTFRPEQTITRAEMLKIVMEMNEMVVRDDVDLSCFPDVEGFAWYAPYICTVADEGLINGHEDGLFRPNSPVTVHEALALAMRIFNFGITDATDGPWYENYETIAHQNGIFPVHRYRTDTYITRGQATELMLRLAQADVAGGVLADLQTTSGCAVHNPQVSTTLSIGGTERSYLLGVPEGYDHEQTYGLIIAVHGRTNNNQMVRDYMGLESGRSWSGAEQRWQQRVQDDFIVAYPAGLPASGGGFTWLSGDHLLFVDTMIRDLVDQYCIDREQIFVVGHSLGGWMTNKLACRRGDVFRGAASVAGTPYSGTCTGPVASLYLHHPDDNLVAYSSGRQGFELRRTQNQCTADTVQDITLGNLICQQQTSCRIANAVTWCDYDDTNGYGPHSWPRGGGSLILDFFRTLSL